jgi:hypothetical protein
MTSAAGGLEKGNSYTIKLKQLSAVSVQYSAPPLVFGMLHTTTGGDLTGGDKPRPYVLMFHSEELIMIASWY